MESRGRESKAEREVAKLVPVADTRPEPPALLSVEEAEEWRRVVNHMPQEWYRQEYYGELVPYCQQVVLGAGFAAQAKLVDNKYQSGLDEYIKLTKAAERANRVVDKIGTTLRITPQSRYDREKASRDSNKNQSRRPWEPKQPS